EARTRDDADTQMLLHDYPDEWAKVYTSFDLAGRDPVRRACDKAFGGFTWERIDQLIPMTRGSANARRWQGMRHWRWLYHTAPSAGYGQRHIHVCGCARQGPAAPLARCCGISGYTRAYKR